MDIEYIVEDTQSRIPVSSASVGAMAAYAGLGVVHMFASFVGLLAFVLTPVIGMESIQEAADKEYDAVSSGFSTT